MSRHRLPWLLLLLALPCAPTSARADGSHTRSRAAPKKSPIPKKWRACHADADCVQTAYLCTPEDVAINKAYVDALNALEDKQCPDHGGALGVVIPVACKRGACVLVMHPEPTR